MLWSVTSGSSADNARRLIAAFVEAMAGDPVQRRELRYRPADALARWGLAAPSLPRELPIRSHEVSVWLDEVTLFGIAGDGDDVRLPLEARLVVYALRGMALLHGDEPTLGRIAAKSRYLGLAAIMAPHEFLPLAEEDKNGFVNLGRAQPARAGSGNLRGLVIAADWNRAVLGWLSLLFGWHDLLGRLLGYPECCTAAFAERWPVAARDYRGDAALLLLSRETPVMADVPWQTNVLGRCFTAPPISHFPCSLDCSATRELADRTLERLCAIEPEQAAAIRRDASLPLLVTEQSGVFRFDSADFSGHRLTYDAATVTYATRATEVAAAVASARAIDVRAQGLYIGGQKVDGHLLLFRGSEAVA